MRRNKENKAKMTHQKKVKKIIKLRKTKAIKKKGVELEIIGEKEMLKKVVKKEI